MKNLKYICVQPATLYYVWQVEVMLSNFLDNGISSGDIDVVVSGTKNEYWRKLVDNFPDIRFSFYEDNRISPVYIPSVRPHILKKHFTQHPELNEHAIFYHDCDVVFTQKVDWSSLLQDDVWYCSDTRHYISSEYVKSKGFGIYERMCDIVGILENIPVDNELHSGGAQYIMKNVTVEYWDKVERDSESLYKFFMQHLQQHPQSESYHPIQSWTADMWAVLWNAWFHNHTVRVSDELQFIWPGSPVKFWDKYHIYHNAGVVDNTPDQFQKSRYIEHLPYNIRQDDYSDKLCTSRYVQEILRTSTKTCL